MREPRKRRAEPAPAKRAAASFPLPAAVLLAILALAAFLRFYQIASFPPPLYPDEAMNGNDGYAAMESGRLQVFYPENGGREGLFINIQAILVEVLGNEPWVLRIPSPVIGVLTVWGVFRLATVLFSVPVGLLSAFFVATSFWHINFSRIGLRAISAPLCLVWALYFLYDAMRRAEDGRPYLWRIVAAGAMYGLGFHTYLAYRATPPLVGLILLYWLLRVRKDAWKVVGAFTLSAAVVVAPLAFYFIRNSEAFLHRSMEVSIFRRPQPFVELTTNIWKTIQMIFTKGDYDWAHNIAFRPVIFAPVAILLAIGIVLALMAIYRGLRSGGWLAPSLLLMWLALGAIPAVLSVENMPNALRSIMMIPPLFILAGTGGNFVYTVFAKKLKAQWIQIAAGVLLVALVYEAYHSYFGVWATSPATAEAFNRAGVEIADRMNALPKSVPKYVAVVFVGRPGGMPIAAQTVMFLTRSYTERQRQESNIEYIVRQPGDPYDGVDFCRSVAATKREGEVFCLQIKHAAPPVF